MTLALPHDDPSFPDLLNAEILPSGGEVEGEGAKPPKEEILRHRYAMQAGTELGLWLFLAGTVQVRSCQRGCRVLNRKCTRSRDRKSSSERYATESLAIGKGDNRRPTQVVQKAHCTEVFPRARRCGRDWCARPEQYRVVLLRVCVLYTTNGPAQRVRRDISASKGCRFRLGRRRFRAPC